MGRRPLTDEEILARKTKNAERSREWRKANPEKAKACVRASLEKYKDVYKEKFPEWQAAYYLRKKEKLAATAALQQ